MPTPEMEWEVLREMDLDLQNAYYVRRCSLERAVWEQKERLLEEIAHHDSEAEILQKNEEG